MLPAPVMCMRNHQKCNIKIATGELGVSVERLDLFYCEKRIAVLLDRRNLTLYLVVRPTVSTKNYMYEIWLCSETCLHTWQCIE